MNDRLFVFHFENEEAQRLDKYLVTCLPDFSRTRLQGLIKDGYVTVDGETIRKTGKTLEMGSLVQVRVPPPTPSTLVPESIPLDILFENEDVMVVNKPAGMVVHPAAGHASGTLVHAALAHAPEMAGIGGEGRPGIVHRLDKNTSGIILLAKNDFAHRQLQEQFQARQVEKVYLALVENKPPTPTGRIEAPIGRDPVHRKHMAVVVPKKGRQAISEYKTLETFPQHTLLEIHPITGRTHQIRLHLSYLDCPVVGDTTYGRRKTSITTDRHFLHAARLTINLPGESKASTFEAPLPGELEQILQGLRGAY